MSDFKPTASQQTAIELRGSTALVSAGAGSGKTKVLTERLMKYILDKNTPVDIDSFLIITFTRAAAGELRGRIMAELAAALAKDPGNKHLRRQSALCSRAQISTIHGFCSSLLRENAQSLGISQDFKIIDDERAFAMKNAALERVLEERYSAPDAYPGFKALADTVGVGRDDGRLVKLVLSLYEKMQCHARPDLWAERQKELMQHGAPDAAETPWGKEVISWAQKLCTYWAGELERCTGLMEKHEKIVKAYSRSFSELAVNIRELEKALSEGWDSARARLPVEIPKLGTLRASPDPELSDMLKARRKDCASALGKINDAFYSDSAKLMAELAAVAPAMCQLLELTLDFDAEYSKAKRRASMVDYSDLEHMAARLLTEADGSPTELAKAVSRRFTEIMVDEYQDVSRVQDTIFRAVSRNGRNLFMVGDVKQSIYRFRLADPEIFTEKYNTFADCDRAAEGEERRVILSENFRSRREILSCANAVFSNCMSESLGDLDYDANAALKYGAGYKGEVPVPEIMLLQLPKAEAGEESPAKAECEARMVALKIKELVESGATVEGNGGPRPISYGDIAILLRSANNIGGVYRRILSANGVPVASGQGGGFYSSIEVSTVLSMLAVTDNPHQDIPLIAVLRSPAFGFSGDELSEIRSKTKDGDFYTALCLDESEKTGVFLKKLNALRELAPDMEPTELMRQIFNELDMPALCSAMSDGEQRRRNLSALLQLAEKFSATGFKGLHRFVLWFKRLAEQNREPAAGGSDSSAVQIMSVHKSKGLEFPVVFLCDTARKFNKMDSSETVLVHPTLGLGPKVTDLVRRIEYPTIARNAIRRKLDSETLSEEMRLLYVALTRPKERLFITAALKDPAAAVAKCSAAVTSPVSPELLSACASPAEWMIYAALADNETALRIRYCLTEADAVSEPESVGERKADAELTEKIEKLLSFSYPHAEAEALPSKVTATELKHETEPDPDAQSIAPVHERRFDMPDFAKKDKPLTGTEKGVATHLVLQYMDFSKTDSLADIENEISRLYAKNFLSERERKAVDAKAILKLFASPLGKRMKSADKVTREFKFSLLCDAAEIFGSGAGDEVLLQGVADCCIEENGELTIIDYKTDGVFGADIEPRAESYAPQLRAYAKALSRIFDKPVRECALYFLRAGKTVTVDIG